MIVQLGPIIDSLADIFASVWMVFLRVGALVAVLPGFGEQSVPMRIRLGLAFAFTAIVAPTVPRVTTDIVTSGVELLMITAPELLTGLFFGMLLRFFIFALQIAGSIAAQSTSLSQIFGGSAGTDPQPAMGHVLVVAGLAYAALMDIHIHFANYIIYSYELVPLGQIISGQDLLQMGLGRVADTFALGFSLAAPFVIASLLYNVVLGVINRAMPQLMVSFVGAPAITAGGLLILAISAPLILTVWIDHFGQFLQSPIQ